MREIKFRGYSEFYKKWLYGSLVDNLFKDRKTGEKCSYIFDTSLNENYDCWEDFIQDEELEVITNSVSQYTGLKDKNGVEIYEGDIVVYDDTPYNAHASILTGVIKMENHSFKLISIKPNSLGYRKMLIGSDDFFNRKSKVIGNIYENPELLEQI